jgi:hypothetical protein
LAGQVRQNQPGLHVAHETLIVVIGITRDHLAAPVDFGE